MSVQRLAPNPSLSVAKFGGGVMPNGEAMGRSIDLARQNQYTLCVVSAFKGVTDQLIAARQESIAHGPSAVTRPSGSFASIKALHDTICQTPQTDALHDELAALLRQAHSNPGDALNAHIQSFGERICAVLFSHESGFTLLTPEQVRLTASGSNLDGRASGVDPTLLLQGPAVIAGYYGMGGPEVKLFGRGGSDYTAAFLAKEMGAGIVDFWKNVKGYMTADPNVVSSARLRPEMTFSEVEELGCFGSKIIHPAAAEVLQGTSTVARVRNFYSPAADGTVVANQKSPGANGFSIAYSNGQSLISLHSTKMAGRSGYLLELLGHLKDINLDVTASSETTFSFTVDRAKGPLAVQRLEAAGHAPLFYPEVSLVAVIGDKVSIPNLSTSVSEVLREGEVTPHISSHVEGRQLSMVIDQDRAPFVINALHEKLVNHHY